MSIPKVIHRIWLDDPMPTTFKVFGDEWSRHHPEWERMEWTSSKRLPRLILEEEFRNAKRIMPKDWKRFQADILRLELLNIYGGVYADTDVHPLKPFDTWLGHHAVLGLSPNKYKGRSIVTQAIMMAEPRSPFILRCIEGIPTAIRDHAGKPLSQVIGPHHIQRTLDAMGNGAGVHVVKSSTFYPVSIADRDRGVMLDITNSYSTHGWNTTAKKRGKGVT